LFLLLFLEFFEVLNLKHYFFSFIVESLELIFEVFDVLSLNS
jgi:hypothetical protein